eukprot:3008239-Prymnesium_polylepis.2
MVVALGRKSSRVEPNEMQTSRTDHGELQSESVIAITNAMTDDGDNRSESRLSTSLQSSDAQKRWQAAMKQASAKQRMELAASDAGSRQGSTRIKSSQSLMSDGALDEQGLTSLSLCGRLIHVIKRGCADYTSTLQGAVESVAALFYLLTIPYQLGVDVDVDFNTLYAVSYVLDAVLILCILSQLPDAHCARRTFRLKRNPSCSRVVCLQVVAGRIKASEKFQLAVVAAFSAGPSKSHSHNAKVCSRHCLRQRAPMVLKLLLILPFDALVWGVTTNDVVPFLRLPRYVYGIARMHRDLVRLEQTQTVPFVMSRMLRSLIFTVLSTHCLACAYIYVCSRPSAVHYSTANWITAETVTSRYLRSSYWSLMTFVGVSDPFVDIVSPDVALLGKEWEVASAIIVAIAATFGCRALARRQ